MNLMNSDYGTPSPAVFTEKCLTQNVYRMKTNGRDTLHPEL